jgi:hypothetical protein
MNCRCDERYRMSGDKRERMEDSEYVNRYHDCDYVRRRGALSQKAETNVVREWGYNLPSARFTRLYALEMETLAREAKLI